MVEWARSWLRQCRVEAPASDGKAPRTARGERTLRKILDAAARRIRRARLCATARSSGSPSAPGSRSAPSIPISIQGGGVPGAGARHVGAGPRPCRAGLRRRHRTRSTASAGRSRCFLEFVRTHRDVYRIIDEAEFVDPAAYREHYETTATRIAARLRAGRDKGEIDADAQRRRSRYPGLGDRWARTCSSACAIAVWDEADPEARCAR